MPTRSAIRIAPTSTCDRMTLFVRETGRIGGVGWLTSQRETTMPIEWANRGNGFILWPDAYYTPSLGIESDRLRECVAEVQRRKLRGVFGTVPYFREEALDFLSELPELEAVEFWDVPLRSISALYGLGDLRYLRLTEQRPPLDLTQLRSLRVLVWNHVTKDTGVGSLHQLNKLNLWRYRPLTGTFGELDLPSSLTELGIFWSSAKTLDGLPSLPKLTHLEVARCRNLESLGRLAEACPALESLLISESGRLRASEAMRVAAGLPRLRHLVAENKLLI